ncbi:hypothetical protein KM043_016677 [Ampulex compressa]|nr:hypothetical protein KM043_016677 [Ampulex compressa]
MGRIEAKGIGEEAGVTCMQVNNNSRAEWWCPDKITGKAVGNRRADRISSGQAHGCRRDARQACNLRYLVGASSSTATPSRGPPGVSALRPPPRRHPFPTAGPPPPPETRRTVDTLLPRSPRAYFPPRYSPRESVHAPGNSRECRLDA